AMSERVRQPMPLHTKIVIGMIAGATLGGGMNALLGQDSTHIAWLTSHVTDPLGTLFLRLLLLLVVPLVFSSLIIGVTGIGDIRKLGRVGLKCLVYTIVISAISVVIGLTLANTIRPGKRIDPAISARLQEKYGAEAAKRVETTTPGEKADGDAPLMKVVKTIVPTNFFAGIAKDPPDMIGLMFVAVFFGIALTLVAEKATT
ncbi:MAG: cation:dicarboxylate symporter family transporter, partial [Thermoanaerobaculia bacterium]